MQKSHHLENIVIYCLLFFGSLLLFVWGQRSHEIIGFDSRLYLFAREMWQNGLSWFPTTYKTPYPDYPVTSTLFIYAVSTIFGTLNKLTAIIPSALMAAITVIFTYAIGALSSRRWGLLGVMLLLLTVTFFQDARGISLDMYPTAVSTVVFYLLLRNTNQFWILLLLILSFAVRGPIGLVIPAGVAWMFYLINRDYKNLFKFSVFASITLILCVFALLFIAYKTGGMSFTKDVLHMEVGGRLNNYYRPRFFYLLSSFKYYSLSYTLAILSIIGMIFYSSRRINLLLIGWLFIVILGLTIPDDKKVRYILPMVPAAALLAAYIFIAPEEQRYFYWVKRFSLMVFSLLPSLLLTAAIIISNRYQPALGLLLFLGAMQIVLMGLLYFQRANSVNILFIGLMSFISFQLFLIEPFQLNLERGKTFVIKTENLRNDLHAQLVFYHENKDGLPIKYRLNMPLLDTPVFIQDQTDLLKAKNKILIVSSAEYIQALPQETLSKLHIVSKDTLGHVPVMVLTN